MLSDFQIIAKNAAAPFTLKLHRGDGMTLLAMNWKDGTPPRDFVGFAIEYKEPGGDRFCALKNRLTSRCRRERRTRSALQPVLAHPDIPLGALPANAEEAGEFIYRVTPVFMNSFRRAQLRRSRRKRRIVLRRETYPDKLNVTFTRGFVLVPGVRRSLRY